MVQPKDFERGSGQVCKLNKLIYVLNQVRGEWNEILNNVFQDMGVKRSEVHQYISANNIIEWQTRWATIGYPITLLNF